MKGLCKIMNAKLSIEKVTPKKAAELLSDIFEDQRKQRESYVETLAREMKEGRWRLSCDAILVVKGKLANGQHRLSAVIKSNTSCPFIIMETADEELYKVIDAGRKRTVGDVLITMKNSALVAAIASWIVAYKNEAVTRTSKGGGGYKWSRSETIEYAQANVIELEYCAGFVLHLYRQQRILTTSIAGALLYIGRVKNSEGTERFLTDVFLGGSRNDSAYDFRERCLKHSLSKAKLPYGTMLALGIKSLKSYLQGTRPGVLKFVDNEEYPRLDA